MASTKLSWYLQTSCPKRQPNFFCYACPFGGNFVGWIVPSLCILTHFKVDKYDHTPSHRSRYTTLSASMRSGKSINCKLRASKLGKRYQQNPSRYSFSSAAIFTFKISSRVLAGLPGRRSFFNLFISSSCWCTKLVGIRTDVIVLNICALTFWW